MEKASNPLILITNDDGIDSEGIRRLVDFVAGLGELWVVAPDRGRSGGSAAITCDAVLRPRHKEDYMGAVMVALNGTPADCVKLGVAELVPRRPALVLSGINHGSNTGNSVVYSGTMGAAIEGCLQGLPAVGFSLTTHKPSDGDFAACGPWVRRVAETVLREGLPEGVCLNVNMPAGKEIRGLRRARACRGRWTHEYVRYTSPSGHPFFMLSGNYRNDEPESMATDLYWLSQGYISVVPTRPDRNYEGDLPFEL